MSKNEFTRERVKRQRERVNYSKNLKRKPFKKLSSKLNNTIKNFGKFQIILFQYLIHFKMNKEKKTKKQEMIKLPRIASTECLRVSPPLLLPAAAPPEMGGTNDWMSSSNMLSSITSSMSFWRRLRPVTPSLLMKEILRLKEEKRNEEVSAY